MRFSKIQSSPHNLPVHLAQFAVTVHLSLKLTSLPPLSHNSHPLKLIPNIIRMDSSARQVEELGGNALPALAQVLSDQLTQALQFAEGEHVVFLQG